MFCLTDIVINTEEKKTALQNQKAGAFVSFEGWVRNLNEGKQVKQLEYEAYSALARKEAHRIIAEAKEKFSIFDIHCFHRTGLLNLGEIAVWIGVTAKHRRSAFLACQYMIDELKTRVPIWKKEYYVDGDSDWVECHECSKNKHQVRNNLSGCILAGGKSKRMNYQDKGLLTINKSTFAEKTLATIKNHCNECLIITNTPSLYEQFKNQALILRDIIPEKGPLAGILTALKNTKFSAVLFSPCDTPLLSAEVIEKLIERWSQSSAEAIIPSLGNQLQPLNGIYSKNIVQKLKVYLQQNSDTSVKHFLSHISTELVVFESKQPFIDQFRNINSPEDYAELTNA